MRTFSRIRGKNGIPKIKKTAGSSGWQIDHGEEGLKAKSHEDDPIVEVDESNKIMRSRVPRGPYCPVAVYKFFVKIFLSLMPNSELQPFQTT